MSLESVCECVCDNFREQGLYLFYDVISHTSRCATRPKQFNDRNDIKQITMLLKWNRALVFGTNIKTSVLFSFFLPPWSRLWNAVKLINVDLITYVIGKRNVSTHHHPQHRGLLCVSSVPVMSTTMTFKAFRINVIVLLLLFYSSTNYVT